MLTIVNKLSIGLLSFGYFFFASCSTPAKQEKTTSTPTEATPSVEQVAAIKGQQLTGVTITDQERIFVNFPRWRNNVSTAVAEVQSNHTFAPYPNQNWNNWEVGDSITDSVFVAVQSVVAHKNLLYVVDTRNPLFQGVVNQPIVFVFDLAKDQLVQSYKLPVGTYHPNSYINDIRIDAAHQYAYFTDSGVPGLVALDLTTGDAKRVLDHHAATTSEVDHLTFDGHPWKNTVHSDGIALDVKENRLYFHALTGYNLYSVSTKALREYKAAGEEPIVRHEGKTAAPDGMIFDRQGNLYYADLENNKIDYRKPGGSIHTLVEGKDIKWADSFSILGNYLYFTNSRINESMGDITNIEYTVNRIALPQN